MKIKYISCDGVTEVEEEIVSAQFYIHKIGRKRYRSLHCERSPQNPHYITNPHWPNDHSFTVDFERIEYVRV